jgi:flavodoxin
VTKTLIAYHSRSGYTRRVAESLARRLRADTEEIGVIGDRQGLLGYARCALEALGETTPAIGLPRRTAAEYDLVVIGTPVWFWALSSPVRSYIMEERRNFARVAFFCTMGGSGAERAFATMAALCGKEPVATLALTDARIDGGAATELGAFVRALRGRGASGGPRKRPGAPRKAAT